MCHFLQGRTACTEILTLFLFRVASEPTWLNTSAHNCCFFFFARYDFFLVSQSVRQGTVSPTHYNVIEDSSGLTPDHFQRLTYKLTHLYYNWPVSIKPSVVNERNRTKSDLGNQIKSNFWYLNPWLFVKLALKIKNLFFEGRVSSQWLVFFIILFVQAILFTEQMNAIHWSVLNWVKLLN